MTSRTSLLARGQNAVVELIRLRTQAKTMKGSIVQTFLGEPLFESLPSFDKKTVTQIANELKQNTIAAVLQMIWFDYDFTLREVERYEQASTVRDVQTFEFLYQILGMFLKDIHDAHSISVVLRGLCKAIESPLHEIGFGLFIDLSLMVVEYRDVVVDDELYDAFIGYVEKEPLADGFFHDQFCGFVEKIVQRGDDAMAKRCLNDVAKMVQEQKRIMCTGDYTRLIAAIGRYIERLDEKAVYILCHCATLKESQSIASYFGSFAGLMFNNFQKRAVVISKDEFNRKYYIEGSANSMIEKELDMPPAELIESSFSPDFSDFEKGLEPLYDIPAKSAYMLTTGFQILTKVIVESDHFVDFCFVLCEMMMKMKNLDSYSNMFELFYNDVSFCESNTVFSIFGLKEEQNSLRNAVFELFIKDGKTMQSLFYSGSSSPILMAEHFMRLSFKYNDTLKSLICTESGLSSLISCATTIQQSHFPAYYDRLDLARSITLSVLFGVIGDPDTALRSLSCSVFSLGFMSLIYDPALVSLVISAITTCIKRFDTLPEPVRRFLVGFYQNCASSGGDEQFVVTAKRLSQAVIEAISQNPKITPFFAPMFDSALDYLGKVADKDTLESVLSLVMLMTQSNAQFDVTPFRFNTLLDMIARVDGDEPSQMVMEKLHNILNGSSILKTEREVLIYVPQFIPLILAAVSKSTEKMCEILEYFKDLCRFSIYNIHQCHEGNLSFILLEGLRGELTYKERQIRFAFGNTQGVFELLTMLVSVRSSYKVDMAFIRLIRECNEEALMCLSNILSSLDNQPRPFFPVFQPASLLKVRNYPWKKSITADAWTTSFYVKVDTRLTQRVNTQFNLIRVSCADPNVKSVLTLYVSMDRLYMRYEGDGKKYTSPIIPNLPANEWCLISLVFRNKEIPPSNDDEEKIPMILVRYGALSAAIQKFSIMNFGEKVNIELAYTESESVESQLVFLGPFAFHDSVLATADLDSLMSQGLAYFNSQVKPFLCNSSPCVIRNKAIGTRSMNIYHTLSKHLEIEDLLPIFDNVENISQIYLETVTRLLIYCAKKAKGNCIFDIERAFHVIPFSGLSAAFWRIHERDSKKMRNTLYEALFHVFRMTRKYEIFDNLLCNFSLWSDEPGQVYRIVRTMNANCDAEDLQRAFVPVLIQSTKGNFGKCPMTYRLLERLCEGKLSETDVSTLFAVMSNTEDEEKFLLYFPCVAAILRNEDVKVPDDRCFSILKFAMRSQKSFDALCGVFYNEERLLTHLGVDTLSQTDFQVAPECFGLSAIKCLIKKEANVQLPEQFKDQTDIFWAVCLAVVNQNPGIVAKLAKENMERVLNILWLLRAMDYDGVDQLLYDICTHVLKTDSNISELMFISIFYSLTRDPNASFSQPTEKKPFVLIDFVQNVRDFNFTNYYFVYRPIPKSDQLVKLVSASSIANSKPYLLKQDFNTRNTLFEHITMNLAPKYREKLKTFIRKCKVFFSPPAVAFNADEVFTKTVNFFDVKEHAFAEKAKETRADPKQICRERLIPAGVVVPERKKLNPVSYKKVTFCRIVRKAQELPCMLVLSDNEMIFRIDEKETDVVQFIAITFISLSHEGTIEIFVGGCESFLLKFEMAHEREALIKLMDSCNLPIINASDQRQLLRNNWKLGGVSASDYLTCLNILNGRSLNDASEPVMFPLIRKRNEKLVFTDMATKEPLVRLYKKWASAPPDVDSLFKEAEAENSSLPVEVFVCPEFFGTDSPVPSGFDSAEDFVYQINKYLEDQRLKPFLTNCLGLKSENIDKVKRAPERETKVKPFPFETKEKLMHLRICERDGVCIAIDANNVMTAHRGRSVLFSKEVTQDYIVASSPTCMLIYCKLPATMFKITFGSQVQLSSVSSNLFITHVLSISSNEMIYVIDQNLVYFSDFVNDSWLVGKSAEKIAHIGFNRGRRALVYTSAESSTLTSTFLAHRMQFTKSFTEGPIENLLVTRQFGFVVVHCGGKLFVHSLTLKPLKSGVLESKIVMWTDVWIRGVDYVVGVDEQSNVFYFECFYPDQVQILTRIDKKKIIGLDYNDQTSAIIVSTEAQLFSLPFSPR